MHNGPNVYEKHTARKHWDEWNSHHVPPHPIKKCGRPRGDARYFHEWIHNTYMRCIRRARARIRASERRWISRSLARSCCGAGRAPNDVRRWVSIFIVPRRVYYTYTYIRARALWIYVAWCWRCQITRLIRHAKHPQTKRCTANPRDVWRLVCFCC